jgi:hypothetical protein
MTSFQAPLLQIVQKLAFYYCIATNSFDFPLLTNITESVFQGCQGASSFDFPLVTNIDKNGFRFSIATEYKFPLLSTLGTTVFDGNDGRIISFTCPDTAIRNSTSIVDLVANNTVTFINP